MYSHAMRIGGRRLMRASAFVFAGLMLSRASAPAEEADYTTTFPLQDCNFKTYGVNPYFILVPGYHMVLEGEEDGEEVRVESTVLSQTEDIFIEGVGKIKTRVVRVREWIDGELAEDTRDLHAICAKTNDVYYFGEDVDNYEDGEIVNHDGAWRAGVDGALPGIIMPGTFLLGSRYHQEVAPGVAMDRAEHLEMGLTVDVPAGTMPNSVAIVETTPLDAEEESIKVYSRGVGLAMDDELALVEFGFVSLGREDHSRSIPRRPISKTTGRVRANQK